jgi:class 3 adenylate cyclase
LEERFKAAVHAAAGEIGQEYLKEIEPYLGGVDVRRLLALIPSDVLSRAELRTLIRSYDRGSGEDGLALGAHAVYTLFNAGLLGIVQFDASRGAKAQRFLSPGDVSLDQEGSLPSSSHYLVRPVIAEITARHNADYAHNADLSNLIGGDRPWKEPKRAKSGYAIQNLCVLHADIRNFSRLMQDVAADRGVREAFARSAKANASPCIYFEIVNGDSLWIVHDDPNVLLKAATRIKEDLFEAPGNPELRMAADFGSVQLRRGDKKRMSLAGGEAVRRVARIEPRVRVSEMWVTEEFKRELEKKPTLYRAMELRPEQSEASSHFNVRKPDSGEADLFVKLYRIGPKSA